MMAQGTSLAVSARCTTSVTGNAVKGSSVATESRDARQGSVQIRHETALPASFPRSSALSALVEIPALGRTKVGWKTASSATIRTLPVGLAPNASKSTGSSQFARVPSPSARSAPLSKTLWQSVLRDPLPGPPGTRRVHHLETDCQRVCDKGADLAD